MDRDTSPTGVGRRLKALRKVGGFNNQKAFAEIIGVTAARYNHWEKGGQHRLPVEYAIKIMALTGAELNYIYLGEVRGIPASLVVLLKEHFKSAEQNVIVPQRRVGSRC